MVEKKNLKQRINEGEVVIGAAVPLTATRERLEEVIKEYPYDYFALDSQHSAFCEHDLCLLPTCVNACQGGIHRHPTMSRSKQDVGKTCFGTWAVRAALTERLCSRSALMRATARMLGTHCVSTVSLGAHNVADCRPFQIY